jgi:hypothetical protein
MQGYRQKWLGPIGIFSGPRAPTPGDFSRYYFIERCSVPAHLVEGAMTALNRAMVAVALAASIIVLGIATAGRWPRHSRPKLLVDHYTGVAGHSLLNASVTSARATDTSGGRESQVLAAGQDGDAS